MSIVRHDPSSLLSLAAEHGNTVYLAGVVAKNLKNDVKGQTKEVLDEIDRLLAKCGSSKSKVLSATIWAVSHTTARRSSGAASAATWSTACASRPSSCSTAGCSGPCEPCAPGAGG